MAEDSSPTPLDRLARLERFVEELLQLGPHDRRQRLEAPGSALAAASGTGGGVVWPAGELLLIRLQRRHPEALQAYEAPVEILLGQGKEGVRICRTDRASVFRLVQLRNGDALVYPVAGHQGDLYGQPSFLALFEAVDNPREGAVLARPALARPISFGEVWSLESRGRMEQGLAPPPSTESLVAPLEQRLEGLERRAAQLELRHRQDLLAVRETLQEQALLLQALSDLAARRKEAS
jgi:hypothetical protein